MDTPLRLDTSLDINLTDGKGKLVLNEAGKPVQIAQDLTTGEYFAKVGDAFPYRGGAVQAKNIVSMMKDGVRHVAHSNEKFRGVWAPVDSIWAPMNSDSVKASNGKSVVLTGSRGASQPPDPGDQLQ